MNALAVEALVVGIMVYIINGFVPSMVPFRLIVVGALAHYLCEFIGFNKWYCKKGNACVST